MRVGQIAADQYRYTLLVSHPKHKDKEANCSNGVLRSHESPITTCLTFSSVSASPSVRPRCNSSVGNVGKLLCIQALDRAISVFIPGNISTLRS
eukprot:29292-Eustigmatos_ZCMA.PRE.1